MRQPIRKLTFLVFVFLALVFISARFIRPDNKLISPFPFQFFPTSNLKLIAESSFNDLDGKYAVYVQNLKTKESLKINADQAFGSASLYKLWVMAIIFDKVAKGELKESESIEGDIEGINKKYGISKEDAELTEGYLQYSIKSAIEQMITISHNYAALLLLGESSNSEVNQFIKDLGLKNSMMTVPPQTTASDIALFYERLYKGEVVNSEYSQKMIEVLKKQKLNDRLAKELPERVEFAHKTGNLDLVENDAGIIYSPKGDYIIVVLTESKKPLDARDKMAEFSKAVYEYFNK